jgi:hypothetical protein
MITNIDQHVKWATENSLVAFDGFPTPRTAQHIASQPNIDGIAYDFTGRYQLEAMCLDSSSGASANKQSRSGAACLSFVGLQELQKCQAVRPNHNFQYFYFTQTNYR